MNAEICLKKLQYVGVLAFATVDSQGNPQIRNISAIHYEPDALYFFTARGKDFCRELLEDGRVQILAYTRYKEMIRLSAKALPAPRDEQDHWIEKIFQEQPYLANVYPGNTREIGIVFEIRDGAIEYFNLGVRPIFRESYTIGQGNVTLKGYQITEDCIGCGGLYGALSSGMYRGRAALPDTAGALPSLRKLFRAVSGICSEKTGR